MLRFHACFAVGVLWLGYAIFEVHAQAATGDAPQPDRNRLVRVVTICQDGLSRKQGEAAFDATLARLEESSAFEPDIACLPEGFIQEPATTLPNPATGRISRWARENNCYVICPLYVREDNRTYNSALLIDRKGEIVGRYDKIRPTEGELERGISPGPLEPPVFKTDFGTIGIQTCFDVNWHEQWRRLKAKGAEIVFFPAAFPAARQCAAHAWRNQYFVVGSSSSRKSSIYDITGELMATSGPFREWAGAVLPLGKRVFEVDYHADKLASNREEVRPARSSHLVSRR